MNQNLIDEVANIVRTLDPISKSFVVVGGISTFLFDYHELADTVDIKTTYTKDLDVAIPPKLKISDKDIEQRFFNLGFTSDLSIIGDSKSPLIKYSKIIADGEIEVEFLVPLLGSDYDKDGNLKNIKNIAPGIVAQQLRYLDILINNPYTLSLEDLTGNIDDKGKIINIPNPENYLLHKFITLTRRQTPAQKEKDAFYLFDVINRFKSKLPQIAAKLNQLIADKNSIRDVKNFKDDYNKFFSTVSSGGITLFMNEYRRGYSERFQIEPEQVVAHFMDFHKLL